MGNFVQFSCGGDRVKDRPTQKAARGLHSVSRVSRSSWYRHDVHTHYVLHVALFARSLRRRSLTK